MLKKKKRKVTVAKGSPRTSFPLFPQSTFRVLKTFSDSWWKVHQRKVDGSKGQALCLQVLKRLNQENPEVEEGGVVVGRYY